MIAVVEGEADGLCDEGRSDAALDVAFPEQDPAQVVLLDEGTAPPVAARTARATVLFPDPELPRTMISRVRFVPVGVRVGTGRAFQPSRRM